MMKTTLRTLASLFVLCCLTAGAYAINPLKEYTYTPKDLGLEYSEDSVMTSDGYRIHIWNLPGKEGNDRSVLIAYADAGNMGQWLSVGATLNLLGYDVWMFDWRGFGNSQDFATDKDLLYHSEYMLDFGAVLGHVATVRNRPVDVLALSMGTIITGEHLRQYPGNKSLIRSCIMDGFVTDPSETVRILNEDSGKSVRLPSAPQLLSPGFNSKDVSLPMLLIHATGDTVSPLRLLLPLTTDTRVTLKEFDCRHLQAAFTHTEDYFTAIDAFLKAH